MIAVAVGAALAGLPLLLPSDVPSLVRVVVAALVAAAATFAVQRDRGRTAAAMAIVAWFGAALAPGEGPTVLVALLGGVLLRLWCGLPELCRIGRPVLPDLAPDVLGGAAAAALVLAVAARGGGLPPAVVVLALAGSGVLVSAALLRVRR